MEIPRYDATLVDDMCGNKDVLMRERHDGLFVRHEDHLAALAAQQEEHQRQLERFGSIEEKSHLQTIDERDRAEEALSQAYYLVVGHSPEWSNLFGHDEAINDIDDAQKCLRAEVAAQQEEIDRLKADLASTEESLEAQRLKYDGCPHKPIERIPGIGLCDTCGCSFDQIGDVCALHAPALRQALASIVELRAENAKLQARLAARAKTEATG